MPSGGTSRAAQTTCIISLPGTNTASVMVARNGSRVKNIPAERPNRRGAESKGSCNSRCIPKVHYMMGRDDAHHCFILAGVRAAAVGLPQNPGAEALSDARRN